MADISDVEQAVVTCIASALYPNGPSQSSVVGSTCRIYRGWPSSATLNTDLSNAVANVTVVSDNDSGGITTRYLMAFDAVKTVPGVTISCDGTAITIGGTPTVGDVVGVLVDGAPFIYQVCFNDTADLVAGGLAELIKAARLAITQGPVIIIPAASCIIGRVVSAATAFSENRRQEKDVRIMFWCSTPDARDTVAAAVDESLSEIPFLPLDDGSLARLRYKNTASYDQGQNILLYRRDLVYTAEYATFSVNVAAEMIFGNAAVNTINNFG